MKNYRQDTYGGEVTVDGRPLPPRFDLRIHCPTGFVFAHGGNGQAHESEKRAAQLALALLADHLGDDQQALELYQAFKWEVIPDLPASGWTLTSEDIDRALAEIRADPCWRSES